jgi:DNA topoisomerase VI subunit B
MILTEEKLNVVKSNLPGKTTTFKIALSAKAFKDLYSSRYSNKIQAVMREIACNAADSHVEVGTPNRPIVIHLPNKLEPWLSFQDFGPGLSEERLEQVYTTCYASTKSSSNSETGCFGVGSKSVFCYSDNFQVRNRHNNIEYNYSLFIDENGIPNLTCLSEEPTEEEKEQTAQLFEQLKENFSKTGYAKFMKKMIRQSKYAQNPAGKNIGFTKPTIHARKKKNKQIKSQQKASRKANRGK